MCLLHSLGVTLQYCKSEQCSFGSCLLCVQAILCISWLLSVKTHNWRELWCENINCKCCNQKLESIGIHVYEEFLDSRICRYNFTCMAFMSGLTAQRCHWKWFYLFRRSQVVQFQFQVCAIILCLWLSQTENNWIRGKIISLYRNVCNISGC